MKLLVHICDTSEVESKVKWLIDEVGVPVYRVREVPLPHDYAPCCQIIVIAIDEDTESYLKLKCPPGTFKDFTA